MLVKVEDLAAEDLANEEEEDVARGLKPNLILSSVKLNSIHNARIVWNFCSLLDIQKPEAQTSKDDKLSPNRQYLRRACGVGLMIRHTDLSG